jgi:hypothetical protein
MFKLAYQASAWGTNREGELGLQRVDVSPQNGGPNQPCSSASSWYCAGDATGPPRRMVLDLESTDSVHGQQQQSASNGGGTKLCSNRFINYFYFWRCCGH